MSRDLSHVIDIASLLSHEMLCSNFLLGAPGIWFFHEVIVELTLAVIVLVLALANLPECPLVWELAHIFKVSIVSDHVKLNTQLLICALLVRLHQELVVFIPVVWIGLVLRLANVGIGLFNGDVAHIVIIT